MDFDAAEDSFSPSPPQLGASGGFSLLLSSPGPPSEQTNGHQVGTPADSFEFSPATGMSAGDGEFLLVSHRRSVDEDSLLMASPNELRREIGNDRMRSQEAKIREHSHTRDEASRMLSRERSYSSNTSRVNDHSLVLDRVSDGRGAAWTDGHNDNNGLRELSQSWPSRDEVDKSARNLKDISVPIVAFKNDLPTLSSPRAHESIASSGESRRNGVGGAIDGAVSETAGVKIGSMGSDDNDVRPVEHVVIQNRIGEPLLGENFSVYSDGSSRGLPPPPTMPFSPLPAIGALRQHILTREQSDMVDQERRLTTDHMRRLNQVLAGHLSYSEVPRVHSDRQASESPFVAPQHSPFASGLTRRVDGEDAAGCKPGDISSKPWSDQRFRRLILHHSLRIDRAAIARGWAKLLAAAAFSSATASHRATNPERLTALETYVIELQQQAVKRKRELDKKTRALSILLRDDWAKVALERERMIRAVRVQLAQTEAHLKEQLDTMVENLVSSKKKGRTGRKDEQSCGDAVGNTPEENHGNPAEVFVGEAGGMVALQGESARQMRAYLASNGRHLKRVRAEAQQWKARCRAMESGFRNTLDGVLEGRASSMARGNGLTATLLRMLDDRDRRLSDLHKDLAALAVGCTQSPCTEDKSVHRKRCTRKKATEILLWQMSTAGEEARSHIGRLVNEVRRLESALIEAKDTPGRLKGFPMDRPTKCILRDPPVRTKAKYQSHDTARHCTSIAYEAGIQTATDAYDLISSLRSEVAALEHHRDALQSKLKRLEETAAASTINNTAANAATERVPISHREGGKGKVTRSRPAAETPGVAAGGAALAGARVASNPARERQARRKDRKARAAAILLQVLQGGEGPREGRLGSTDAATMFTTDDADINILAAAAKRKGEQRHRAQEEFTSRKSAEVR